MGSKRAGGAAARASLLIGLITVITESFSRAGGASKTGPGVIRRTNHTPQPATSAESMVSQFACIVAATNTLPQHSTTTPTPPRASLSLSRDAHRALRDTELGINDLACARDRGRGGEATLDRPPSRSVFVFRSRRDEHPSLLASCLHSVDTDLREIVSIELY